MFELAKTTLALLNGVEVRGSENIKRMALAMQNLEELQKAFAPKQEEKKEGEDHSDHK